MGFDDKADGVGGDGVEEVDLLVADGGAPGDGFPLAVLAGFDAVAADALALGEVFLDDGAVEAGAGLELEDGVALEPGFGVAVGDLAALGVDGFLVGVTDPGAEFGEAGDIDFGHQAAVVGGEAEDELGAAAGGLVVHVLEFIEGFEAGFGVRVPEPVAFAEGGIGFGGAPAEDFVAVDDVPVFLGGIAGFVADPADVGVREEVEGGEDEGVGLVGAELADVAAEVVDMALGAGAVEPEFGDGAVAGGEFGDLTGVVVVVGFVVAVGGGVAIPGGEVDAELEAMFLACIRNLTEHVFLVRTGGHGVFGVARGPETEPVMMFRDHDQIACAGGFGGGDPLFGVERGGIEDIGGGRAVAPFAVEEGIGAEVDQDAEFELLPGDLLGGGADVHHILGEGEEGQEGEGPAKHSRIVSRLQGKGWLWQTGAMRIVLGLAAALLMGGMPLLAQEERLLYGADWRFARAGEVELHWAGPRQSDMTLKTLGLVGKLYKVDDVYRATFDPGWCALTLNLDAQEGRRHRVTQVTYDRGGRKVSYIERDVHKNEVVRRNEMDTPECVHEVTGALQRLRELLPAPGTRLQLPVSDGKKMVSARVESLAREKVKVPLGEFSTIKYEAFLFNDVLYRRKGRLFVWLTDDDRRLPVQIRIQLPFYIGTVTLRLERDGVASGDRAGGQVVPQEGGLNGAIGAKGGEFGRVAADERGGGQ